MVPESDIPLNVIVAAEKYAKLVLFAVPTMCGLS
jgi:hypothetical protein